MTETGFISRLKHYKKLSIMTKTQFKSALNNEFKKECINRQIEKVRELDGMTVLVFKNGYDMKTLRYLNNRFANGISITETDHSIVFINQPNQQKVDID